MYFYEIAILNTPTFFTYQSDKIYKKGDVVKVSVRNSEKTGIVLRKVKKPPFKCKDIIEKIYEFDEKYLKIIEFISFYYFCSIGEAAGLFQWKMENGKREEFRVSSFECRYKFIRETKRGG